MLPKIDPDKPTGAISQTLFGPTTERLKFMVNSLKPSSFVRSTAEGLFGGLYEKYREYQFNRQLVLNPSTEGFSNKAYQEEILKQQNFNPLNPNPSFDTDQSQFRGIIDSFQKGFDRLVKELRAIRMTVLTVARVGADTSEGTKKSVSKLDELILSVKSVFGRNKYNDREDSVEGSKLNQTGSEADPYDSSDKNARGLISSLITLIATSVMNTFTKIIRTTPEVFSKAMRGFELVFKTIGDLIKPAEKVIEPITKAFNGIVKFAGRFGKLVPVIGEAILVISTIFDAVKGFVRGWKETEGNVIQKTVGAFKGGMVEVLRGLADIPKMIIQALKGVTTFIADLFGADKLADKLRGFNFGKWFDKMFDTIIENFPAPMDLAKKFGEIVFEAIKLLLKKSIEGVTSLDLGAKLKESAQATIKQAKETEQAVLNVASNTAVKVSGRFLDREVDNAFKDSEKRKIAENIYNKAIASGFSKEQANALVATAIRESRLDPNAQNVSKKERSYGLFQANQKGGLGTGYTSDQLKDPNFNTNLIFDAAKKNSAFMAAQTNHDAAAALTKNVIRPANQTLQGAERGAMADRVQSYFTPKPTVKIAPKAETIKQQTNNAIVADKKSSNTSVVSNSGNINNVQNTTQNIQPRKSARDNRTGISAVLG